MFTVKSFYDKLAAGSPHMINEGYLWRSSDPPRVIAFCWLARLHKSSLLTRLNVVIILLLVGVYYAVEMWKMSIIYSSIVLTLLVFGMLFFGSFVLSGLFLEQ